MHTDKMYQEQTSAEDSDRVKILQSTQHKNW